MSSILIGGETIESSDIMNIRNNQENGVTNVFIQPGKRRE
jgi:hypothetical protein